jgi:hypothetical protein
LHALLLQLHADEAPESQLVRAVEDADAPWRGYRAPQARNTPYEPSAKARISRLLHQVSLMAGVKNLAFSRPDLELVARDGNVFESDRSRADVMGVLAAMFRERVAASTKRLGIGAMQEAEISLDGVDVLAFGGLNSVLLVEVDGSGRPATIVAECRDVMGSLDRAPGGAFHA